jgi:hypothetical protein
MEAAVVGTLAESGYTEADLLNILWDEVHPACLPNLLGPAGEWAAFDAAWLKDRILDRPRHRRWPAWLDPGRRMMGSRAHGLIKRVAELRAANSDQHRGR